MRPRIHNSVPEIGESVGGGGGHLRGGTTPCGHCSFLSGPGAYLCGEHDDPGNPRWCGEEMATAWVNIVPSG